MNDPYKNLANAIILQAVKDYRDARRKLKRRPKNEDARLTIQDCESFFCSRWFEVLTDIDGTVLLERLKEEDNEGKRIFASGISSRSQNKF